MVRALQFFIEWANNIHLIFVSLFYKLTLKDIAKDHHNKFDDNIHKFNIK